MNVVTEWINTNLGINLAIQYKLVATILIWAILYFLRRIAHRIINIKITEVEKRLNWSKSLTYIAYFLFIVIVSPIWFSELHSLGTFLGLLTAGLAVALKEPISNFFAWFFIVSKKPFVIGDRIQIENTEGDILDIGFFEFTMLEIKNWVKADQSTGRIVHIPNGLLFTKTIMNYNQALNYIWIEVSVNLTFESNYKKAKNILSQIENDLFKEEHESALEEFNNSDIPYQAFYNNMSPKIYTLIRENGIQLTLRVLSKPKVRRESEQMVYEAILDQFLKHDDIKFAYPTTRFYQSGEPNPIVKKD